MYKVRYIMRVFYTGYCYCLYFQQKQHINHFLYFRLSSFPVSGNHSLHCRRTLSAGKMRCRNLQTIGNFKSFFQFKTWRYQTIHYPDRKSSDEAVPHGFFPGGVECKEVIHRTNSSFSHQTYSEQSPVPPSTEYTG